MANVGAAKGLEAVSRYNDTGFVGALKAFHIRSDYATAVYRGDPLHLQNTGSNDAATSVVGGTYVGGVSGFHIGSLPNAVVATAGATNRLFGAVHSVGYNPSNPDIQYGPASTDRAVLATVDPAIEYEIYSDAAASGSTYTDIGLNANLASGSGSTVFGTSGWYLNSATFASDATYQMIVLSVSGDMQRCDLTAANPSYICKINLHSQQSTAIAGV